MAGNTIALALEIDDKGTATIKNFAGNYEAAMNKVKSSTDAANKASLSAFERMRAGLNKVRISWIGLTAAIAGFVYSAKKAIDSYLEQERAENALANAMRNAKEYTEAAHQEMIKYATALQMSTKYGDEAIMQVMNLLYTYKLNTSEVKWATQATLDFASALGMDAQSAARYLGMAMSGNINMLARYVPALKSTVSEQLKHMSATEKVAFMMQKMNEQFGGRAQAELATYGAKLTWLKGIMGDIEQTMVTGLLNALTNQATAQDNAAESFKRLALIMTTGAESITKAILFMAKSIASVIAGFDTLLVAILKVYEYINKLEIALAKMKLSWANWKRDIEGEKTALKELADAQQWGITISEMQADAYARLGASGEIIGSSSEEISKAFREMRKDIEGFGKSVPNEINNVTLSVKELNDAASKMTFEDAEKAFDKIYKEWEDYTKTVEKVQDRLKELSLSEYDYKIYLLDKSMAELKKTLGEQYDLTELYYLERRKIAADALESEQKEVNDKMKEQSETLRETFRDLFLEASGDDFDNWIDRLTNKFNNFIADIIAAGAVDIFTGGKAGFGILDIFKGASSAGLEGPLMESGKYFSQASSSFGGAVKSFGSSVLTFAKGLGPLGLAGIGMGVGTLLTNAFAPSSMKGKSGFSGFGGGVEESWNKMGPASLLGYPMPLFMASGIMGMMGLHPFASSEQKHQEAILKRAQEFFDEYAKIMKAGYSSLAKMGEDFNYLMSAKHIEAIEELGYISKQASVAFHATALAFKALNKEAMGMGSSVGTMRRLETVMEKTAIAAPEMAEQVSAMLNKMKELFTEELFADFEKEILDTNLAIKELIRTGMSQLDAQIALLGEDYENLVIAMNGSIEALDLAGEAFNGIYDALDNFDSLIEALPNSLKRLKKSLYEVSYELRYLMNMMQSFINLRNDFDDIVATINELGYALITGDLRAAATDLNTLQMYALEAASAVQQLADAFRYVGNKEWATRLSNVARVLAEIGALFAIGLFIVEMVKSIKDMNDALDSTIDKFELLERKVKRMSIKDVVSDLADQIAGWDDIIARAEFGDIAADMGDIAEEFTAAMMMLERLRDSGRISQEDYTNAATKAVKAYTQEIKEYFDEVLSGFDELSASIGRSIQDVGGGRTAADVTSDFNARWAALLTTNATTDPEKFLSIASEIQSLIIERYQIEKAAIEEQIAAQEKIKSAYQSVVDTVTSALLGIQTGGLNPQTAQERLTYFEQEANRLRGLVAGETNPEKMAGYQNQLVSILTQYLTAAEEVFQRPSNKYQDIYQAVTSELEGLRTDAQDKISAADAEIIRLNGEMTALQDKTNAELATLKEYVDTAGIAIAGIRDDYMAGLTLDMSATKNNTAATAGNTAWSATKLSGIETLLKTRFPAASWWMSHQTGIDYVPRDNYPAILHKGESVVRARERGGVSVPINFTINASGATGKQLAEELKNEIKWGRLGTIIEQRIRKVA